MKRLLLVLALVASGFSRTVHAQTLTEHLDAALVELNAARALLPPPGPVYTSLTDHTVKPKPAPLALGPAGFTFTDPTFGSPMWRVTDRTTSGGSSLRVPSSAHATAWNSTGTKFYVVNEGGGAIFFGFDGAHTTKLTATVVSQLEPQFSFVDPQLVFGVSAHTVKTTRLDTGVVTPVLDLDATYPQLPLANTYVGGILLADGDKWIVHFGGGGIDQHVFVHHSTAGLLDVRGRGWKVHAISIDRTGRFVQVYPANDPTTGQLPPGVAQVYLWDTQAGTTLTVMAAHPSGHGAHGYNQFVNQDCCTTGTWDASQWQIRTLTTPTVTADLIPSVLTPQEVYLADHTNWRAARPDVKVPIVSANYRFGDGLNQTWYPWRAWDEEIVAIATDGSGTVWRFAHHQSIACTTAGCDFWSEPMVSVAPDGKHAIFTSNWGNPTGKQDVFLVELR